MIDDWYMAHNYFFLLDKLRQLEIEKKLLKLFNSETHSGNCGLRVGLN